LLPFDYIVLLFLFAFYGDGYRKYFMGFCCCCFFFMNFFYFGLVWLFFYVVVSMFQQMAGSKLTWKWDVLMCLWTGGWRNDRFELTIIRWRHSVASIERISDRFSPVTIQIECN